MKNKRQIGAGSSLIAIWAVIGIMFILAAVSLRFSLTALGVVLAFLAVLGLVARLWSKSASKSIEAGFSVDKTIAEIGQTVNFKYTVENRKPLPVMWMEFCVRTEENPCIIPGEGFDKTVFEDVDAERFGFREFYRRRLIFIMGFQELSWSTPWLAQHRGIFIQEGCFVRTGDCFGLSESSAEIVNPCPAVAVLPKIYPVNLSPFLRQAWQGNAGKKGQVEDISILNSLRDYQNGDSWKRIDWRAAARQDEIKIKIFEKVTPERVHFIFDCASFIEADAREYALSVIASLLVALDSAGIPCGITLPCEFQTDMYSENGDSTYSMLYELAGFDVQAVKTLFDTDNMLHCASDSVQLWIISSGGDSAACRQTFSFFENTGLRLLTDVDCRADNVSALKFEDVLEGGK